MDEKKKRKKFVKPEAEEIKFNSDDIIVTSLQRDANDAGFEDETW